MAQQIGEEFNKQIREEFNKKSREEFNEQIKKVQTIVEKLKNSGKYGKLYNEWKIEEIHNNLDNELNEIKGKHENIEDKSKRKRAKFYFLGKMSSGKTKLINGIIGDDLLKVTSNHTTNCFVHIRKSNNNNYKIIYEKEECSFSNKTEAQTKINQLSTAGNGIKFDKNKFVETFIPINKNNKILTENVELIDTPGLGNQNKITDCIQKYSIDTDMFIFVLAHDITEEEEKFFICQINNSTKPNILILINKWDQTDKDDVQYLPETRESLLDRCKSLFTKISGSETQNINNKVYFVSAEEVLNIQIKISQDVDDKNEVNIPDLSNRQKERYDDYLRFENDILKYIQDLENNKFLQYKSEIEILRKDLDKLFTNLSKRISRINSELPLKISEDYKSQINQFKETIEAKCEKQKLKCEVQITCVFTKMLDKINFDAKEIMRQVSEHYSKIDKSIEDFIKELEDQYDKLIKEIKNIQIVNKNVNSLSITNISKEKQNADSILNKELQIKENFEEDLLSVSQIIIRILSIIPLISAIATNIHFSLERCYKKETYESKLNKINNVIHDKDEKKLKILNENISKIKDHFISKANQLLEQIDDDDYDSILKKNYKTYLINLFK